MKHFEKVQTFEDLKEQYRKLAKANHPDAGGDIVVMQEINAEYEILFPIYRNKHVKETGNACEETAHSTRQVFYTQNGWVGDNYDRNLTTKDIAERVRAYVKEAYPTYKFSIRTEYASMCSSIHVALMEAPEDVFVNPDREKYEQLNSYYLDKEEGITELGCEVMKDINDFICSYRYNDSDGMIDYFDTNFYYYLEIGRWDKPFKVVEKKARVKAPQSSTGVVISNDIEIVNYSEKAIAVFGTTKPIKEKLSELGGSFNYWLNYKGEKKPGWIFPKRNEDEIRRALNL